MELKTIYSNTEPTDKNVVWLQIVDGVPVSKIYTANGWQPIGKEQSGTGIIELSQSDDPEVIKEKLKNIDVSQPFVCIIDGVIVQAIPDVEDTLWYFISLYGDLAYSLTKDWGLVALGPCNMLDAPISSLFSVYMSLGGKYDQQTQFYQRFVQLIDQES